MSFAVLGFSRVRGLGFRVLVWGVQMCACRMSLFRDLSLQKPDVGA